MCLEINEISMKKTAKAKASYDYMIAYKVICADNISPYRKFKYKNGWNYSGRQSVELTPWEKRKKEINNGFHCFTTREAAREEKRNTECDDWKLKIYRVKIPIADLVAIGIYGDYATSLVCTKLYFDPSNSVR